MRPQTFIVKFLVIGTNTETGFYSRVEIKGASAKRPVETQKRVRVWVVRSMRKLGWRPKKVNASKLLPCELLLLQLCLFKLFKLREGRKRGEGTRS